MPDDSADVHVRIVDGGANPRRATYLTVGMASARRPGGELYLVRTLRSLLVALAGHEERCQVVVLLLGDDDGSTARQVRMAFDGALNSGLLMLVKLDAEARRIDRQLVEAPIKDDVRRTMYLRARIRYGELWR